MAGITLRTIGTPVHIIILMAAATLIAKGFHLRHGLIVTTLTRQPFVGTGQDKICLPVMIEMPAVPVGRVMTGTAV